MKNSLWIRTTLTIILLLILIGIWYFDIPHLTIISALLALGSFGIAALGSHIDKNSKEYSEKM
ncbi:hypothetical protein [Weissella paramesenteroides]|uniref:hypothetical protein n=1 Tax=Weissella paramesenteroides TaxID=1249 RepID=UPI00223C2176|nr:hypothetical protein [Weissella paramesenteroides]MCT0485819.1 hypothetical protein [Weissella paramesenteroides]